MKCKELLATAIFMFTFMAARAQSRIAQIDSVHSQLIGAWRMNADTNMYLVFTTDSVVHHMFRTSGTGRSKYEITTTSCDLNASAATKAYYIVEAYRYYLRKEAKEGKLCSEIVSLKNGELVLKRDKVLETYTKLRTIPVAR